ncbi:DEAD/DEAH box helicase [Candidatus Poribacteria bacterium]|nr:DEAD/DEAH box helicase [Candidatus Poribacteria bacterium]
MRMLYKGYILDPFQERAIRAIEEDKSVIVAAPTGAGKTLIAEYAVEKCLEQERKIIYTAPIKALSNQKYRDFYADYGDMIGIMTGDVVLNPDAPALIMTTEIFRNTIFEDISRLDDIDYVIFDEIHYINDIQRGTVWEESIIFAPQHIKFVCLSATMPNLDQFARWMRSIRRHPIVVINEESRPVPLEHKLYIRNAGIGDLEAFKSLRRYMKENGVDDARYIDADVLKGFGIEPYDGLVEYMKSNDRLPCLFFCFSRSRCEEYARWYSKRDFLNEHERQEMIDLYERLCTQFNLMEEPGYERFKRMLSKGVAYHHAGILPTFKEVIERLFTSGLIKLLFTTETFAVGINMPARTVAFEGLEKYDGVEFRYLKTREYHQMAGRAGRRGIDPVGYVYAQVDPYFADPDEVERIVAGPVEPIESQFNLSYASILNLYDKYKGNIYDVCDLSLGNFQALELVERLEKELRRLNRRARELKRPVCIREGVDPMKVLRRYVELQDEIGSMREKLREARRRFGPRRIRRGEFGRMKVQIGKLERKRRALPCNKCPYRKSCLPLYKAVAEVEAQRKMIRDRKKEAERGLKERIARRLDVLWDLGYIDEEGLLPRGRFASQIYGYEMQVTQLFFGGHFERLSEDQINVLIMAIVFESKKDEWFAKLRDKEIKRMLSKAKSEVEFIRQCELKHNIADLTPQLDDSFSAAMLAWSQGCKFQDLRNYTSLAEGDIVRAFRNAIDLLRQMRRVLREHPTLYPRINGCIDRIKRDVVDAERELRMDTDMERESLSGTSCYA